MPSPLFFYLFILIRRTTSEANVDFLLSATAMCNILFYTAGTGGMTRIKKLFRRPCAPLRGTIDVMQIIFLIK